MTNQEIDRLVAEKVMGWKLMEYGSGYPEMFENGTFLHNWEPTTEMNDAFQVAIRMKELGWQVDLDMYPDEKPGCSLWKTGSQTDAYVEGDSMPLAICLASLQVFGIEVTE